MREEIINKIIAERDRQYNLPNIEFDIRNSPNDWTSIVGHYLLQNIRRGPLKPTREDFEDSLIKAAAVILAALEHCDKMEKNNHF
jgi:hypothetical protein